MRQFIRKHPVGIQFTLAVLTIVMAICNIINSHNVNEREQQLGEAYNSIEAALLEIQTTEERVTQEIQYLDHIYSTAEEYGVPPEVVLAVMKVESSFNPDATNGRCYGLMQVHDVHCEGFGVTTEELLDLRKNTKIGISILSDLMENSDNLDQVLGKYNRGEAGYERYCNEVGTEVTSYSQKVTSILNKWKETK